VKAQINLVPNPSFEDTVACPDWWGQINHAKYWYSAFAAGTPDYFNSCSDSNFGVPINVGGFSYAESGYAYIGLFGYLDTYTNAREIVQIPLASTLIQNKKYNLTFYVKLANVSMYAINSMGCLLSDQPVFLTSNTLNTFSPQINYLDSILDDSINWIKIEGDFIAQGNERYLSIGNFNTDSSISTSLINSSAKEHIAYYYIDNVSLINISSDTTNHSQFFKVYPTLATNQIYLDYNNLEINNTHFVLCDVCGRTIKDIGVTQPAAKLNVDVAGLAAGMYFYDLFVNGDARYRGKIVVRK